MKFNEKITIENHIIKYLCDALGYKYIKPEEFKKLRDYENEFIITPLLKESIGHINNLVDENKISQIVREIKKIDTNEEFLNKLRNGVNIKDSTTQKTINYKIIDWKNIESNDFIVTNQFYFEGNTENIRPDILIFLNGLPIVDIEAKSPTAGMGVNFENAIGQIKRYENVAPKMFLPNCFNIATDGLQTVYGSTYSPKQYFAKWKNEKDESSLEITLDALLEKNNLLDIIKNFILFEKNEERKIKKICRYQQMRATNKILNRVKDGDKKRGLIWHTQGSGKSLTMFFTAWKLRFDEKLKNPKVFVLIDRRDLDQQISDTFTNCGGQNIIQIVSKNDLAKKITNDERGIFISTMQKFNELPANIQNDNENIIVLCDEGHRSNEGFASINLRSSMKNAFFFGFTGTPIDRNFINTHRNFGLEGERYLDYYSIKQAIDDRATLPVNYEARLSKFSIEGKDADIIFNEYTKDLNKIAKNEIIKKYGKTEAIIKLEKRMRAIICDIVEHYKAYVMPNGFKAQIVCYDREATAKYKKLLDELIPADWSAVVYSPGDPNTENPEDEIILSQYNTNKDERDTIINNFKDPKHPLKFILVCDMLLTGFDAPIEQVMYLDKPLRDHNLLQAIARTNRVYPNKGCGRIIDYFGITNNLYKALDFDENIVDSAMINIEKTKEQFIKVINDILDIFVNVNLKDPRIENLRTALNIFRDNEEKQNYFSKRYSELKNLFEILSPDPFLKKHLRDFEWITSFYLAFIKEYKESNENYKISGEYGQKTKNLIQEKVDYEGITKTFKPMNIHDIYILEQLKKIEDKQERAAKMEKLIEQAIASDIEIEEQALVFSERLNSIKEKFEAHQMTLLERIKEYYKLIDDIKNVNTKARKMGYSLKEFGLYNITKEFIDTPDEKIIKNFIIDLDNNLKNILDDNWQESSKRDQFIKDIKQIIQELVLKQYYNRIKINNFNSYMNRLVDIIIKKF